MSILDTPELQPIMVRYDWNGEGLFDALEVHRRQASDWVRRFLLRGLLIVFAVVTVWLPMVFLFGTSGPWPKRLGPLAIMVGAFGYLWLMFYLALWNKGLKRRAAEKAFRLLPLDARFVEWTFTESQLSNRTALSALTYLWPLFIKIVEAPKGFLLYQNISFFNWIPGHAFASAEDLKRFADLARSRSANYQILGECQFPAKPKPAGMDEL